MRRGLTLVELIVGIALSALVGLPLGFLLSEYFGAGLRARDAVVAVNLARRELEDIDSRNDFFAPALAMGGGCTPLTSVLPSYAGLPYDLTRRVECEVGNCCSLAIGSEGVKRITVTVTRAGSTDPLATLVTFRTKHVDFGA
jgi:hypothetical protein